GIQTQPAGHPLSSQPQMRHFLFPWEFGTTILLFAWELACRAQLEKKAGLWQNGLSRRQIPNLWLRLLAALRLALYSQPVRKLNRGGGLPLRAAVRYNRWFSRTPTLNSRDKYRLAVG